MTATTTREATTGPEATALHLMVGFYIVLIFFFTMPTLLDQMTVPAPLTTPFQHLHTLLAWVLSFHAFASMVAIARAHAITPHTRWRLIWGPTFLLAAVVLGVFLVRGFKVVQALAFGS